MTAARPAIACLGAGRMGRGIAVAFAYAGHAVTMIDVKARSAEQFAKLEAEALGEVRKTLASLSRFGLLTRGRCRAVIARVSVVPRKPGAAALADAGIVFEGVPEVVELKREVLGAASKRRPRYRSSPRRHRPSWSTISQARSKIRSRFLNVHWLNPAYLIPLVEISPGKATDPAVIAQVKALLEGIGKVPVVCAATPGFIVPRIQALAMNEAARMVEEGVASAEDIDKAIRYGFGFRYAVLGLLEFIDWGGGDILYYASRYLEGALGSDRYRAPDVISRNMREGRIGLRTGAGFLDYSGLDVDAYRGKAASGDGRPAPAFDLARPPVLDRGLAEHVLQHAFAHHRDTVELDRRPHHRQIEMARRIAAGEFVGAGREQEIAGDGTNFRAVGVALVIHRQRLVARAGIHAEADMRHRIGLPVAPGGEIGTHHRGIRALAFQLDDIIVLQCHLHRRCQIALEGQVDVAGRHHQRAVDVPLLGKLTTMPPGQCASVPGLSVQPHTPTVGRAGHVDVELGAGLRRHPHPLRPAQHLRRRANALLQRRIGHHPLQRLGMLVGDHQDTRAGFEDLRRLHRMHQALDGAIHHKAGLLQAR